MKQFKSLIALMLAAILVVGLAVSANAVNITITKDSTLTGSGSDTYTYYQMFSVVLSSGTQPNNATGHTNGTPAVASGTTPGAAYKTTQTIGDAIKNAQTSAGKDYFTFTAIANEPNNYSVAWGTLPQSRENILAAANLLKDVAVAGNRLSTGTLNYDGSKFTASVAAGYYVIVGAAGANLIAATTDISINEKNDYPDSDKTQADEDNTVQSTETRPVAVGDVLTYNVKVKIPNTVKKDDTILVWDKPSKGLEMVANSLKVIKPTDTSTLGVSIADAPANKKVDGAIWNQVITINDADKAKGEEVIFEFEMTVTKDALVDTEKENEAGLKYGNSGTYTYDSIPDRVEYKTYYAGIHKIDGTTRNDLSGVKFTLTETSGTSVVNFPVTLSGSYYIPGGSSNEVITNSSGMIIIRGLDGDKTYTLTETETLDGYNKLSGTITLIKHEDKTSGSKIDTAKTDATWWNQVENNKGTILPSTGGIGTTIFYVIGAVLVLGAAAIMIARRKAEQE